MKDEEFLEKIKESFYMYLKTGSRSNKKLEVIHGAIAKDLKERLGDEYKIHSLGYGKGKEIKMKGRYLEKRVDIGVEKDKQLISAIALKFIMRNYHQNSNNYFENMLGETANIRSTQKQYFQIIIIPSKVPYFNTEKQITKIELLSECNISKYIALSNDNINDFMHTPNKTLIYVIDIPDIPENVKNYEQYVKFYTKNKDFKIKKNEEIREFGNSIIYNDYNKFMEKIVHSILSI